MDTQFMATREDIHHVQMDVKHVQAVQVNHADRILRLERRQADDAALKSVWGTGSPFPSVLGGTPQQGPVPNAVVDVFDDFDDEQSQNLLGSLHLDADEEPVRRGASRANSVRFDVSALQSSSWATGSRNSGEFGPLRPNSGLGSHPMTERSLSHRSDGRHSSAGQSVHSVPSGRASSLGLDTNFLIGGDEGDSPLDAPEPPPGLFILGPVPSIIRCWLTTTFSHNALLYAAVCTGSQRSILDFSLVKEIGLADHVQKDSSGRQMIRLPIYLPEAVITQPASRSNSPAPQLPTLTVDFEIVGLNSPKRKDGIYVFLGIDVLRAHSADILFSQNLMTLYGDDRKKLSVPFVRPEDENAFKYLGTCNMPPERLELKANALPFMPLEAKTMADAGMNGPGGGLEKDVKVIASQKQNDQPLEGSMTMANPDSNTRNSALSFKSPSTICDEQASDIEKTSHDHDTMVSSDPNRRELSNGIWGPWRNSSGNTDTESTSGYQRPVRGGGRNMKVLRPSGSLSSGSAISNRSTSSSARTGVAHEATSLQRASGEMRRKSQVENVPPRWENQRRGVEDQKASKNATTVPKSSNPVGGASAFSWMNSGKPKATGASAGD